MSDEPIVIDREPTKDELSLGYAHGFDQAEGREMYQLKFVPQSERRRHFYVIGASDTGKSKFLEHIIKQDIQNEAGFGIIDPHGDLVEDVKEQLAALTPYNLEKRVVLIDPADKDSSICYNPLERTEGMEAAELAAELVEVFAKIWPKAWGERTDEIFRNTLIALIENDLTLAEFSLILDVNEPAIRAKLTANLKNIVCREFFEKFEAWDKRTKLEYTEPILNKVGKLLSNPKVMDIFTSPKSSFNLREIMDDGKILLVKLSKGSMKDASTLLGAFLLNKIEMATFSRTDTRKGTRKPFYLYVDEFENFATDSFLAMLSETRKYGLFITLAHQELAQLTPALRAAVLTNCGIQVCFRLSRADAEILAKETYVGIFNEPPPWERYIQELQSLLPQNCLIKSKVFGGVIGIQVPWVYPAWEQIGMEEANFVELMEAVHFFNIGKSYLRERVAVREEHGERMAALAKSGEPGNFRVKKKDEAVNYGEMIKRGENDGVEFKASLRWGYEQGGVNKLMEYMVAKAMSAFMNAEGGTLFIGVHDTGEILGLEKDYATVNHKNKDGFLLQLTQVINKYLGKEFHQYTNIEIVPIGEKDICAVNVSKSKMPVYLKNADKEKEEFYIRASASSQPMNLRESNEYIKTHFFKM